MKINENWANDMKTSLVNDDDHVNYPPPQLWYRSKIPIKLLFLHLANTALRAERGKRSVHVMKGGQQQGIVPCTLEETNNSKVTLKTTTKLVKRMLQG